MNVKKRTIIVAEGTRKFDPSPDDSIILTLIICQPFKLHKFNKHNLKYIPSVFF